MKYCRPKQFWHLIFYICDTNFFSKQIKLPRLFFFRSKFILFHRKDQKKWYLYYSLSKVLHLILLSQLVLQLVLVKQKQAILSIFCMLSIFFKYRPKMCTQVWFCRYYHVWIFFFFDCIFLQSWDTNIYTMLRSLLL